MWGGEVYKVRTLFLRCVSLCYAVAFHSLYTQLPGLYGEHGLLPARLPMDDPRPLSSLLQQMPTLLWLVPYTGLPTLAAMELLCLLGATLGLTCTLLPSLTTVLAMLVMHITYLSLLTVGGTFLHFQWDTLLLETGMLAVVAAPLLRGYNDVALPKDHTSMALVRWLLFRMMFASGAVKLTSGCPAWWGLTAMPTHYFSQCLPTPLAWFAALQPTWLHKLSVVATYVIEIPLAFLFFAPTSSLRKFTALGQILLMLMIMFSGNYNFFNFLYLVLCFSLADNSWISASSRTCRHAITSCLCCILHVTTFAGLGWAIGQAFNLSLAPDFTLTSEVAFSPSDFDKFLSVGVPVGLVLGITSLVWAAILSITRAAGQRNRLSSLLSTLFHISLAIGLFCLSLPSYAGQLDRATYDRLPRSFKLADRATSSLHLTNSYGLFRQMTGVGGRPEVVLEGAMEPQGPWVEYDFMYKPGNTSEAPQFMLPHQPRLDWQMWFAALGSYQNNPWLVSLAYRLLEGRREVMALLSPTSPWQDAPPTYIRARKFIYTFTSDLGSAKWWKRKEEGEYLPVLARDHQPLVDYLTSQGILGLSKEAWVTPSPLLSALAALRKLSDATSPHIQIWSYAWLVLPLFKPFIM